ncbi:MAG: hypothetical protein FJX77_14400, partial [Armatimonadetes bacterium]|nr:hypothetical protein [Armatimonadota bacterium]
MRLFRSRGGTLAALVLGGALMCLSVTRAAAQFGLFDAADWMVESDLLTTGAGDIDVSTPLENRYLTLWAYEGTDEDSKFSLWTNIGDPLNPGDDQFFVVDRTVAPPAAAAPWGSRVFCSDRGEAAQDRPYGNIVTVRMDDPANPGAFLDQVFPDDGAAQFAPPRVLLPLSQGYFSPYLFDSGNIKITQKLTLIRDLLRVEYEIVNQGGTARRVGIRLLQNPYFDNLSVFVPSTRQRIFKEVDFGIATGTGANPPRRPDFPTIPPEMQVFSQDDALNPAFNVKCVFTGPGITSPTRVAIVDALKVYPTDGQWDYSVAFGQELRISDIGFLIYWDPVLVPAGQRRSFVNYVGMAAATQAVSNAFLLGQNLADNNETQGYVAAVQTPEATPLVNGNADVQVAADPAGTPIPITVDAYMHSLYHRAGISSAFAFLDIPDGLQFITTAPDQSLRQDIGALEPVSAFGGGVDERQVQWTLQANGIEAGLLN